MNRQKTIARESPVQSNTGVWASRHAAEFMLKMIISHEYQEHLIPYYVSAICSGIEGQVNTAFIDHFHKHFGKTYRSYVRPYLLMKIYDRFVQLPIIVSNFKYVLNQDNPVVKEILSLFDLRNQMLHVKHLWHYADIVEDATGNIIDIQYHDPNHPDPYRESKYSFPDIEKLKKYMWLFNKFIPKFSNIANNINRKNFNPEDWFVLIKKT